MSRVYLTLQRPAGDGKWLIVKLGPHTFFTSYEEVVAYRGPNAPKGVRRKEVWSHTTRRHMGLMDCKDFTEVPITEFAALSGLNVFEGEAVG